MYLLTIKDGLVTRHVGPYSSPKDASDDLERVLAGSSERAKWQIHALESPLKRTFSERLYGGGNISFNIYNGWILLDASPFIGYKLTPKYSTGFGVKYIYRGYPEQDINQSYYGVVWDRQIPINIQDWLNKTDPSLIPSFREICHKNEVSKKIINIFENSKLTNKKKTEWLIQDITNLSEVFSNLMKIDYIRLRFKELFK